MEKQKKTPCIAIFTGTKAQFIKMVPIAFELQRRGAEYRLIDTGQHGALIKDIIGKYGLDEPDVKLTKGEGVSSLLGGLGWFASLLWRYILRGSKNFEELFGSSYGYALVHGDTASTLVSTLVARRGGQKVVHVEAGLRSWDYLNPFPEELIRIVVMKMADVLFVPSEGAMSNLRRMKLEHRAHRIPDNTLLDTVRHDLAEAGEPPSDLPARYCVVTLHRLETLYRRAALRRAVEVILDAHERAPVVLVGHHPTMRRLDVSGFGDRLSEAGVMIKPLMDHGRFLALLQGAEFLMTDGGSVQEEASYLGVPTLLLRRNTERDEGLDTNVCLSRWDAQTIHEFFASYPSYRREPVLRTAESPSSVIVDVLENLAAGASEADREQA